MNRLKIILLCSLLLLPSCKVVGFLFWQDNIPTEKSPEAQMYSTFFSNHLFLIDHGDKYQLYSNHQASDDLSLLTQLSHETISANDLINLLCRQYLLEGPQFILLVTSDDMPRLLRKSLREKKFKIIELKASHDFSGSHAVTHILSPESFKIENIGEPKPSPISISKSFHLYRIWVPKNLVLNKTI